MCPPPCRRQRFGNLPPRPQPRQAHRGVEVYMQTGQSGSCWPPYQSAVNFRAEQYCPGPLNHALIRVAERLNRLDAVGRRDAFFVGIAEVSLDLDVVTVLEGGQLG